jgi:hypothetical protein
VAMYSFYVCPMHHLALHCCLPREWFILLLTSDHETFELSSWPLARISVMIRMSSSSSVFVQRPECPSR